MQQFTKTGLECKLFLFFKIVGVLVILNAPRFHRNPVK